MSEWKLVYEGFEPNQEGLREALCTLGNGYVATRGAAEEAEADDVHYPGTYLAGGYNRLETDIAGPEGLRIQHEKGADYLPALARAHGRLGEALASIRGVLLERKRFAIAVHFRQVAEVDIDRVEAAVDEVVERFPKLRKTYGKKIFELRPRIDWDKGKAVLWLLEALGLQGESVLPLYVGDDTTDEDAFAALAERGIGILVAHAVCFTAARYVLRDPNDVARFLRGLIAMLKGGAP